MAKTLNRRFILSLITLGGIGLVTSACGRKNAPKHPDGATYPRRYPYEPDRGVSKSSPEAE